MLTAGTLTAKANDLLNVSEDNLPGKKNALTT
jgi:hypothetical protein